MFACLLLMYIPMGWIPVTSISSTHDGYSQSPPAPRFSVIPVIRRAARWWNPSRTLSTFPVATQLSVTYKITDCSNDLYISPRACTVAPVLSNTLTTIPHHFQSFRRFC